MSMLGELLSGLVNSCGSLGSGVTGGCVARQYASKYSEMCSQASSSWFSSSITSNISGGHWASFSDATICTFRCRVCDLPRDLIKRWSTYNVHTSDFMLWNLYDYPEIIMYTPISCLYTIKTVVWQKGQSIDLVLSRQRKYSCSRTPGIKMS